MDLNRLYLENGKVVPFCARREFWPPKAYFYVKYVQLTPSAKDLLESGGPFFGRFWGFYCNPPARSRFQVQFYPSKDDWSLVPLG